MIWYEDTATARKRTISLKFIFMFLSWCIRLGSKDRCSGTNKFQFRHELSTEFDPRKEGRKSAMRHHIFHSVACIFSRSNFRCRSFSHFANARLNFSARVSRNSFGHRLKSSSRVHRSSHRFYAEDPVRKSLIESGSDKWSMLRRQTRDSRNDFPFSGSAVPCVSCYFFNSRKSSADFEA